MIEQNSYWLHDWSPFLIRFPNNPLGIDGIRYYGLAYLLSFLGAWLMLKVYNDRGKFAINADTRAALVTAVIIGVLAGGRLGYMLLYDLETFMRNPMLILRVDQGGMSSHGGFLGVAIALFWFTRKYKYSFLSLGDVIVTLAPIGFLLGRIANFINGELWGRVSYVSWAIIFPHSPSTYNAALGTYTLEPRHPSQLYQATLEGGLLLFYMQWRFWRKRPPAGQIACEFLISYGVLRVIGEVFREPDASLILNISRGQFYSIFIILIGIIVYRIANKRHRLT
ncbi:MAG: prolipoprotein diacylglyceryl transferase [Verrucomicrobiota bacterium]|nr:prolipoprotein diacylglyceryl transferase [Verrucomicrobiota bacterium]